VNVFICHVTDIKAKKLIIKSSNNNNSSSCSNKGQSNLALGSVTALDHWFGFAIQVRGSNPKIPFPLGTEAPV